MHSFASVWLKSVVSTVTSQAQPLGQSWLKPDARICWITAVCVLMAAFTYKTKKSRAATRAAEADKLVDLSVGGVKMHSPNLSLKKDNNGSQGSELPDDVAVQL